MSEDVPMPGPDPSYLKIAKRGQFEQWPLAKYAVDGKVEVIKGDTDQAAGLTVAYDMVMIELSQLGNSRCNTCGGFGHSRWYCPTGGKLDNLGRGGRYVATVLKRVRDNHASRCVADLDVAVVSMLKVSAPNKRKRVGSSLFGSYVKTAPQSQQ